MHPQLIVIGSNLLRLQQNRSTSKYAKAAYLGAKENWLHLYAFPALGRGIKALGGPAACMALVVCNFLSLQLSIPAEQHEHSTKGLKGAREPTSALSMLSGLALSFCKGPAACMIALTNSTRLSSCRNLESAINCAPATGITTSGIVLCTVTPEYSPEYEHVFTTPQLPNPGFCASRFAAPCDIA